MRTLFVAVLLALVACSKEPPTRLCNYCKAQRNEADVKLYSCRKCGNAHWSCSLERPLHAIEYSHGSKKTDSGGAIGYAIKSCPD